jgi:phosphoglycolate phosphatase
MYPAFYCASAKSSSHQTAAAPAAATPPANAAAVDACPSRHDTARMDAMKRPCHAVILDLDGTIANTLTDITNAVNHALRAFGLPPQPIHAVRRFVGDGVRLLCQRAGAGQVTDGRLDKMAAIVMEQYRLHELDHTTLYDGVAALLDGLTTRHIPFAVLSNKPHAATERMVVALCGRWSFAAIEGMRTEDARKPSPKTALAMAERIGVDPAAVWFVGDSGSDIKTARNAGMVAVAATWGFRDCDELASLGPDHMIDHPEALLQLIE